VLATTAHPSCITAEDDVVDGALVTEVLATHATAQLVALIDQMTQSRWDR